MAHSPTRILQIADADKLKDFLSNARKAWYEVNRNHKRGRNSHRARYIAAIWELHSAGELGDESPIGEIVRRVAKRLKSEKKQSAAIRKYARMWKILRRNGKQIPDLTLSDADRRCFTKYAATDMKALRAYHEAEKQFLEDTADIDHNEHLKEYLTMRRIDHSKLRADNAQLFAICTDIEPGRVQTLLLSSDRRRVVFHMLCDIESLINQLESSLADFLPPAQ
jgi:hypothetical protein